jgi:hypothetical protein
VQAAAKGSMAGDRDIFAFESSLGMVTVQWGWNKWVVVEALGRTAPRLNDAGA